MEGELKEESLNKFGKREKGATAGLENRGRKPEPGMRNRKHKSPTWALCDQPLSAPGRNEMERSARKPEEGLRRKWRARRRQCYGLRDRMEPVHVRFKSTDGAIQTSECFLSHSLGTTTWFHASWNHGWKKLCKLGPFLETLSLLFARQRWSETSPSISRHTPNPAEVGGDGQR